MAEQQNPTPSDSDVQRILSTIKEVESSGNYGAKAKGSTASGAYQFINDTWQRSTKRYGIGTEYKTAADAPPEVQDAVAARAVKDILGQVGGDVTKVPLVWYTGNPQGRITEEALRVNRGLTPDKYQQKWLSVFNKGSPTATMAAQTPAQPMTQAPRTMAQATPVVAAAKPSLTDMPPAYRMALAANYLADTESPETSVVERAMEMLNEQQGGAAKNPLAGYMQAISEESVNPFQFVQQEQEEPRRRVVPRMPVRMADGGPVYGVQTNPEVSIKNLQELVNEGQGAEPAPSEGPAASGYGIMADIGNSMVGLSQAVPGMATAALGMIGQAMVNHALAPFAEALSNEAVATAQANAASAVAQGLAAEAEGLGIGPGVGPGIAAAADDAGVATSSDSSDGPGDGGADGASGDGGEGGGDGGGGDGGGEGFKHGGLASLLPRRRRDGSPEEGEQAKDPREQVERRMMYSLGPMDVRAVRKPSGYEARVSGSFNQVVPYMDFDPLTGTFRPTEVGVSYGQMGPEGGYQLRYGQPLPREGQGAAPPQVTGQYRRQLDRNSEVQASGYYIPIPGARDQYGAQFRYLQRFANGGDVVHRQAGSPQQGEIALRTPSISEVPQVDVRGRVIRDVPVPQPTFTPGQQLIGAGETALSALSGLTAPASIAYDVLRGVPTKEVSPSRFIYQPRTEAGQETLQNVGRLAQEYKLDVAMPQVQLQRPYPVGAAARQGIAGLEKGVEKMTLPTFRQLTGNPEATKEQMMDFVLNQKSILQAGAPAISRAPGGTFFTSEGSNLQRFIGRGANEALDEIGDDPEKAAAVSEMFYKKAQDFFEKRAGSISDELKQEMLAGRIKMPGEIGEELFPKYLREAAQRGDISAMRDIERRYDEMLGIKQIRLAKENLTETYAETQRFNQATKQSILAQFKQYPELIPDDLLFKLTNKDPTDVRIRLKDNPEYFSTVLEPKLTKLINIETEIVKPSDILNYESTYGRYAAENLSKNELEAIKRNKPLLDIKSAYQDLFGYDITDLARQAAKMSTKELQDITFATFVSRASKLAVKQKTLEARAKEIQEALKANKSVDPKALSFGTEVFQELPDGFTWRKIVDPDATVIQSAVLDNSISGYSRYGAYGPFSNGRKALENGDVELFVLYDKNGIPVTNVEMIKGQKSGQFSMRQAQGNGPLTSNVTPDDYLPQLKAFINKTTPTDLPFNISREIRYIDAPEGFAKGGIVDKPLYDRAA